MAPNAVAQTHNISKLCDHGYETKSKGVKRVLPGSIRTCSQPSSRKKGHRISATWGAASNTASEVRGANRLAAKPTAKCPMNMRRSRYFTPDINLTVGL